MILDHSDYKERRSNKFRKEVVEDLRESMEQGLLTGFISPIRPKEIVSPSAKSDELFLSWLSDRKTKEFILQLASQVDADASTATSSSSSKKHTGTPKKGERSKGEQAPAGSAPLYSLTSNKYPLSHLRRATSLSESSLASPPADRKDSSQLLSPRAGGASGGKTSKRSPRAKELNKEANKDALSDSSSQPDSAESKSSSGSVVVPQLSLSKLSSVASTAPTSSSTVPRSGTDDLDLIFSHYLAQPASAMGLDTLIDDLLQHFGLPRTLFFPLKYKILINSAPIGSLHHQHLQVKDFLDRVWTPELAEGDLATRTFLLLKEDARRPYLVPTDWIVFLLGLLEEHPGLTLIKGETEYQERYIDAVVVRLHFAAARRTRTRITLREFKNAEILSSIEQLDQLVDITRYPKYFDYMSYFVIFSNFTELDQDKDWLISRDELASYRHHALTTRIVERAFFFSRFLPRPPSYGGGGGGVGGHGTSSGSGSSSGTYSSASHRRGSHQYDNISPRSLVASPHPLGVQGRTTSSGLQSVSGGISASGAKLSSRDRAKISPRASKVAVDPIAPSGVPYSFASQSRFTFMDFAWFIMSEEDKACPASIELWFACLDKDEDGFLSPQDLHTFYEEQMVRMEFTALDIVPFEDALVQIIDMTHPKREDRISIHEIKHSGFAADIFDLIFNLQKFLIKDRTVALDGSLGMEPIALASWDAFASAEYLAALGEIPHGDENDELDDENLDIWVEVATEPADSDALSSLTSSSTSNPPVINNATALGLGTPRDVI